MFPQDIKKTYQKVRSDTEKICHPLQKEDFVVQPVPYVSPPKWHWGHTSWFFETLCLQSTTKEAFHPLYSFLFNSYYESLGSKISQGSRGFLSRPTVNEILDYRHTIDKKMMHLLTNGTEIPSPIIKNTELGIHHEQQHQELLITDIKYILGHNPLYPEYSKEPLSITPPTGWISIPKGNYSVGHGEDSFCFDNERPQHTVYLVPFKIRSGLVTNNEFIEFINYGGYQNFSFWHADGWDWVQKNQILAPLYWQKKGQQWFTYSLEGLIPLEMDQPVTHVSYYEAHAFAQWKKCRLPTEFEWETACDHFDWGERWEWTQSAHLPYPGYQPPPGPLGEYNGKFMVNQMVARGASSITPQGHARKTYRNFFFPLLRWQYTGIRLASDNF